MSAWEGKGVDPLACVYEARYPRTQPVFPSDIEIPAHITAYLRIGSEDVPTCQAAVNPWAWAR